MKLHASLPVPTLLPSATHDLSHHQMRESVEPLHDYHYRVFTPTGQMPAAGWPLLIFLHGAGQCRADDRRSRRALHHEEGGPATFKDEITEVGKFVIAMPQTFCSSNWWRVDSVAALARELVNTSNHTRRVDAMRMSITGYSMGAYGSWAALSRYPHLWAAVAPLVGGGDPLEDAGNRGRTPPVPREFAFDGLVVSDAAVWASRGQHDSFEYTSVPVHRILNKQDSSWTRAAARLTTVDEYLTKLVLVINASNQTFRTVERGAVRLSVYTGFWDAHGIAARYVLSFPEFYIWLLAQRRTSDASFEKLSNVSTVSGYDDENLHGLARSTTAWLNACSALGGCALVIALLLVGGLWLLHVTRLASESTVLAVTRTLSVDTSTGALGVVLANRPRGRAGVVVVGVAPGACAASGIRVGDVIYRINGVTVRDREQATREVGSSVAGTLPHMIDFVMGGDAPAQKLDMPKPKQKAGFTVSDRGWWRPLGVTVTEVSSDGAAAAAGLPAGCTILSINDVPVDSLRGAATLLEADEPMLKVRASTRRSNRTHDLCASMMRPALLLRSCWAPCPTVADARRWCSYRARVARICHG